MIIQTITVERFDRLVRFVIERGDRQTWCNMYNDNPHFAFGALDVFLNPDVGQRNINCDPARSGFDEVAIRTHGKPYALAKRRGDQVVCDAAAAQYLGQIFAEIEAADRASASGSLKARRRSP